MLISYPILSAENVHDDEDIYLGNFLQNHLIQHEGRYPVSSLVTPQGPMHRWHGGVHLFAGGQPIRAIADGTVVAYRFAATRETYEGQGDFDTSFILLRHETQTGENTTAVFYSLYMHLASRADLTPDRFQQLPQWLRQATPGTTVQRPQNQRVWRKDVLGFAGRLYGVEAVHFEVFMLDADFTRVWRDSTQLTQGTGSNDWFGDAHFVIPERQQFQARHPQGGAAGAHEISFGGSQRYTLDVGQAGQNDVRLYVSVKLHQGRRIATTYRAAANGLFEQVGAPVVQEDYEYELYRLAKALYNDCPSAGFEWLRFGRVLGPDTTTNNVNWQLVRYSETAVGYIDLAANAIAKLSDADFPHWLGWERRDEGQTAHATDGLCDDQRTLDLVQAAQGNEAATRKLQHLVCKAPAEWDDSDLATRYARLREPGGPLQSDASWAAFQEHVSKFAFWSQAGIAERSVWHFHPLRFIRQFRNCWWLSRNELVQLLPMHSLRRSGNSWLWENVSIAGASGLLDAGNADANTRRIELNNALRKYRVVGPARLACFFGNSTQETQWYQRFHENSSYWYSPWDGRGFLQLTHAANYMKYWAFKGQAVSPQIKNTLDTNSALANQNRQGTMNDPTHSLSDANTGIPTQIINRREEVGTSAHARADSAGAYWAWSGASREADAYWSDTTNTLVTRPTTSGTKYYYQNPAFGNVAATVNLGRPSTAFANIWGVQARFMAFANAQVVLMDTPRFPQSSQQPAQAWGPLPLDFVFRRP